MVKETKPKPGKLVHQNEPWEVGFLKKTSFLRISDWTLQKGGVCLTRVFRRKIVWDLQTISDLRSWLILREYSLYKCRYNIYHTWIPLIVRKPSQSTETNWVIWTLSTWPVFEEIIFHGDRSRLLRSCFSPQKTPKNHPSSNHLTVILSVQLILLLL